MVYRAEQDHPRREVALKVLQAGRLQERFLRRFETEAQVLGRLSHPGIAQVYEASVAQIQGRAQPYLAMELVEGQPIDAFARSLPIEHQVELLAQVCDAMHHAHQKGVVHRDLKPGNVLVTPEGHPKVVDFGVAHVEAEWRAGSIMETHAGEILGTLTYMSPEQVSGRFGAITPRTDVYALGVMAYRLLSKRDPLPLEGLPVTEVAKRIELQEAPPLGALDDALSGDLETIIAKAMAKEPERRYAHAGELAADLRRHLSDEPILARPASTVYVLRKFVARNRALVTGLTVAFAALLAGFLTSTWLYLDAKQSWKAEHEALKQARESKLAMAQALEAAQRATQRARQDERVADQTARFVASLFQLANPYQNPDATIDSRAFLDLGAQQLEGSLEAGPRVKAKLAATLANLYRTSGHYAEGLAWGQRALDWLGDGDAHPAGSSEAEDIVSVRLEVLAQLALLQNSLGNHETALQRSSEYIALAESQDRVDPVRLAAEYTKQASLYARSQRLEEARQALAQADRWESKATGPDPGFAYWRLVAEGNLAQAEGRAKDLLRIRKQELALAMEDFADRRNLVWMSRKNLLEAHEALGEYAATLRLVQESLAEVGEFLPADHPKVLFLRVTRLLALQGLGRYPEAFEISEALEEPLRQTFGVESNEYQSNLSSLANLCVKTGRLSAAREHFERLMSLVEASTRQTVDSKSRSRLDYAYLLLTHLDDRDRARGLLERALADLAEEGIVAGGTYRFGQKAYALCLQQSGEAESARGVYEELLRSQRSDLGDEHPDVAETLHNLALLERSLGRVQAALSYHEQCLIVLRAAFEPGHPLFGYCYHGIGDMHLQLGDFEQAEASMKQALAVREQALPEGHYMVEVSRLGLALVHYRQGRVADAQALFDVAAPRLEQALPPGHFFLQSVTELRAGLESR